MRPVPYDVRNVLIEFFTDLVFNTHMNKGLVLIEIYDKGKFG